LNVAIVIPDPTLGSDVPFGDSIRLRLLESAISSLGHHTQMLWAQAEHSSGTVVTQRRRYLPRRARSTLRDIRTLARSVQYERKLSRVERPDLVFEFAAYLAPSGLRLAQRLRVPYVVEVEGPLASLRYGTGTSPFRVLGDRWVSAQLRSASSVLTVSRPLANHLTDLGANGDRLVVAPNVANTDVFSPSNEARERARTELGLDRKTFVAGFHGVFSPWYALPKLVEAAARAQLRDVCVLLVGDGIDRRRIEETAGRSGTRIIVTGFVPQHRAAQLIQAVDIGVVPDHAWWTSPLKLFEFGALRIPVVAANVESVSSVTKNAVALFDPADPDGLSTQLSVLEADPQRRARLGDTWHARVLKDYNSNTLRMNVERALALAVT
jgi:glycosyltransferase involved in cell wall biosynthesis